MLNPYYKKARDESMLASMPQEGLMTDYETPRDPSAVNSVPDIAQPDIPPQPPRDDFRTNLDSYFKNRAGRGMQMDQQNQISRQDLDTNKDNGDLRNLIGSLAQSANQIGNYKGNAVESTVPAFAKQMNDSDQNLLDQRNKLSEQGAAAVHSASGDLNAAEDQDFQRQLAPVQLKGQQLQNQHTQMGIDSATKANADAIALKDPNHPVNVMARAEYEKIGMKVPPNATADQMGKIGALALERWKQQQETGVKREGMQAAKLKAAADKAADDSKKIFSNSQELRKELLSNPIIKDANVVNTSYNKIKSSATGEASAAKDMNLVFNYMKMLDPGSTVRESEYANASNTTGAAGQVQNLYNRMKDGQLLNEKQRAEFLQEAAKLNETHTAQQSEIFSKYKGISDRNGLPWADVNVQLGNSDQGIGANRKSVSHGADLP